MSSIRSSISILPRFVSGKITFRKPIRAASRTRRTACEVALTSPASPTSPKSIVVSLTGIFLKLEVTAATMPSIYCWLIQRDSSNQVDKNVISGEMKPNALLEHRHQQDHAI